MDGANIWQCICQFLPVTEILRLRVLSSRHNVIGTMVVKTQVPIINHDEMLRQIFAWIIANVQMVSMTPSRTIYSADADSDDEELTNELAYVYELKADTSDIDGYLEHCDEKIQRIIPDELKLTDVVYLAYDLQIDNRRGPNHDRRGTKFPNTEINDFHRTWKWSKGFMTLNKLADGYFRLKSHKFENWYEMVCKTIVPGYKMTKTIHYYDHAPSWTTVVYDKSLNNDKLLIKPDGVTKEFYAHLSVDHGS